MTWREPAGPDLLAAVAGGGESRRNRWHGRRTDRAGGKVVVGRPQVAVCIACYKFTLSFVSTSFAGTFFASMYKQRLFYIFIISWRCS
jgi:hypothetical protein